MWRPRVRSAQTLDRESPHGVPGAYVGYARYRPRHPSNIPPALHRAIGQLVEVGCAGIAASNERFAGQRLFLEWRRDELFDGYLIPQQDLEFLPARSARTVKPVHLQHSEE